MAGEAFEPLGDIDQFPELADRSAPAPSGRDSASIALSSVMCSSVGIIFAILSTSAYVISMPRPVSLNDAARRHRSEGDDLRDVFAAVFLRDVIDD